MKNISKGEWEAKHGKGHLTKISGNLYLVDAPFIIPVFILFIIFLIVLFTQ